MSQRIARRHDAHDLAVVLVGEQVLHRWDAVQIGRLGPGIDQNVDVLVGDPFRLRGLPARPGIVACRNFATFYCQIEWTGAGVAHHHLELGADEIVEHHRECQRDAGAADAARDDLGLLRILDGCHAGGLPDRHGLDRRRYRSDPVVLGRIELHALKSNRLRCRKAILDKADVGAVLGCNAVEIVGHHHAGRAGHVLCDDSGMSRNILADVTGHEAKLKIVLAAGTDTDKRIDGLALVEVLHGVSLRCRREGQQGSGQNAADEDRSDGHLGSPPYVAPDYTRGRRNAKS